MARRKYSTFPANPTGTTFIEILKSHANHARRIRNSVLSKYINTPTKEGYVYLVYFGIGTYYKIGFSRRVEIRLKEFGAQMPFAPTIEHVINTDDVYALESSFHEYFKTKRIRGEWFDLTPDDVCLCKCLQEISFYRLTVIE